MPRKSGAASAMAPLVNTELTRLAPPRDLDPAVAALWRRLVGSCHPAHFVSADAELLRSYCEEAVLAQEAFAQMREHGRVIEGKLSPWVTLQEKAVRAMALLAPRLRLGPSARVAAATTARQLNGLRPSIYDTLGWTETDA